ncbi:mammalian cell entry protein [Mycolicibacterium vinylchloridicum]|uniref:mammalian cell entry protein n=1 Tax=Mycolicibacterium vinylchloridicum TaxID=2736928 RepID=UPI0015CBC941|nr:mammalian cell entry protein [Mycolicibacterium vinylchloridicum]
MNVTNPAARLNDDEGVDEHVDNPFGPDHVQSPATPTPRRHRDLLIFGLTAVILLSALTAGLGIRAHAAYGRDDARAHFLEAGRQSAIMLTTVKHAEVEADVKHLIDSSTGPFLADFRERSQSFVDTVKRTQSNTEGTIAEAGLESVHGNRADVLVAVSVKTSLAGVDSPARLWRMRLAVEKVGNDVKLSDVAFIS